MQRILPFGREYRASDPFTLDEGQSTTLWLVREDQTTSVGTHGASIQLQSADGTRWTEVYRLDSVQPSVTLHGADEQLTYRVVALADALVAVDQTSDADGPSRTQRAAVDLAQPDPDAAVPLVFKAQAEAGMLEVSPGNSLSGVGLIRGGGFTPFGEFIGAEPEWDFAGEPDPREIGVGSIPSGNVTIVVLKSPTLQADYEGGTVHLWSECGGFDLSMPLQTFDEGGTVTAVAMSADGTLLGAGDTFFLALQKPGQPAPVKSLGARTGRFTLDHDSVPARLSGSNLGTVSLSAVEAGGEVIPIVRGGERLQLDAGNTVIALDAPGTYEWERGCDEGPGVFLSTGWGSP